MKITNVSDKPYEWTWDGGIYGPIQPGETVDLPDALAKHAITRGVVTDDATGEVIEYKVMPTDKVPQAQLREIAQYTCPLAFNGLCSAKPFRSVEEISAHMLKDHSAPKQSAGAAKPQPAAQS